MELKVPQDHKALQAQVVLKVFKVLQVILVG
jgi:hypothetical protein